MRGMLGVMVDWQSRSARSFDAMAAEVVRRQERPAARACLVSPCSKREWWER